MYRSNDYYREIIFNRWFESHVVNFKTMRDGKFCDSSIQIKHAPFITTFNKVYRSNLRHYDSRCDCYADCMALVWEGLIKFRIKDGSTWQAIAEMKDMDNYRKLTSYLKTYVVQNIKKLTQDYAPTTKVIKEDGKKKRAFIFYNITTESLNQIITFDNSVEQVELVDTIEKSYWERELNFKYNLFTEWAKENMDKYLTNSQKQLLKTLQEANYSVLDNDYDKEMLGNNKGCVKLKLDRICEKISAKYMEENKYITGGYLVQTIDAEIKTYKKFINILNQKFNHLFKNEMENALDDDDLLANVIINSLNNPFWERLLYEDISKKALEKIIRAYQHDVIVYEDNFKLYGNRTKIPQNVIQEVTSAIANRIKYLKFMRNQEMELLLKEAENKKIKVKTMHYTLPENYSIIYFGVNAYGVMIQK